MYGKQSRRGVEKIWVDFQFLWPTTAFRTSEALCVPPWSLDGPTTCLSLGDTKLDPRFFWDAPAASSVPRQNLSGLDRRCKTQKDECPHRVSAKLTLPRTSASTAFRVSLPFPWSIGPRARTPMRWPRQALPQVTRHPPRLAPPPVTTPCPCFPPTPRANTRSPLTRNWAGPGSR